MSVTAGMMRSMIFELGEKHRNVVIGFVVCIAPRAGAEQHQALDPIAIQLIERGAEALQNWIVGGRDGHWSFSIHNTYNVNRAQTIRIGILPESCPQQARHDAGRG
jgi:hypothetical protein